jgi:excisionase family DNA binding protein
MHRTFGLNEVAHYLHLQLSEVERLVKEQAIPFERHGSRVVFRKLEIDSWASPRILGLEGRRLSEYHQKSSDQVRELVPSAAILPEMIRVDFIDPALQAKTKASVLREMVKVGERTGRLWDSKALLAGLQQREDLCSTGLPGGLALLHTRTAEAYLLESSFIALGRAVQEVPFGAPDGHATDLFFLIACTDDRLHLHLLARLCLLAQKTDVLEQLRGGADAEAMYDALIAAEQAVITSLS